MAGSATRLVRIGGDHVDDGYFIRMVERYNAYDRQARCRPWPRGPLGRWSAGARRLTNAEVRLSPAVRRGPAALDRLVLAQQAAVLAPQTAEEGPPPAPVRPRRRALLQGYGNLVADRSGGTGRCDSDRGGARP